MHGDSFSANKIQDGLKSSTTFGEKVEPPALPCRDDVSVENAGAAPKSCLSPLERRTTTAAGGLLSTGKTSIATWITFNQPTLWFCLTEEKNRGLQFYTPGTTAASGGITCLLPSPAGGSLKQSWSRIGCLILAGFLQVVSAPAHLWECSARCSVGRFFVWALDGTRDCSVFRRMTWESTYRRGTGESFTPHV